MKLLSKKVEDRHLTMLLSKMLQRGYTYTFIDQASKNISIQSGKFGDNMSVQIEINAPVTILVDYCVL